MLRNSTRKTVSCDESRFKFKYQVSLTSRIFEPLNSRRCDPHTAEKTTAWILVQFLLIPHRYRDSIATRKKKVVVWVPLGIDGCFADVSREDLTTVHCYSGEWVRKSCVLRRKRYEKFINWAIKFLFIHVIQWKTRAIYDDTWEKCRRKTEFLNK